MTIALITVKAHSASWKHSLILDFIYTIIQGVFIKSISWLKKLEENYANEFSGAARETTTGLCARLKKLDKTRQNCCMPSKSMIYYKLDLIYHFSTCAREHASLLHFVFALFGAARRCLRKH